MRDSGRGRIKALERRTAYLEGIVEVLADQNNQVAGFLVQLQRDTGNLAKVVVKLASLDSTAPDEEDA